MRWMTDGARLQQRWLYDASVSDAGDGNEVDDKEFTQKNSVERLINARFEHYSKDPIGEKWQEVYMADIWRAVSRALSSLPDVHMRIF